MAYSDLALNTASDNEDEERRIAKARFDAGISDIKRLRTERRIQRISMVLPDDLDIWNLTSQQSEELAEELANIARTGNEDEMRATLEFMVETLTQYI